MGTGPREKSFLNFVQTCTRIWREQPVFQRRKFFMGRAIRGSDIKDISFFDPGGNEMHDEDWKAGWAKSLGVRLAGDIINEVDERGEPISGDTILLLVNAHWEQIQFKLPAARVEHVWEAMIDTADCDAPLRVCRPGEKYPLYGRSLALLRTTTPREAGQELTSAQVDTLRKEARRANQPAGVDPPLVR